MTSRGGPISRGGGYPASSRGRQQRPSAFIACNRCRKPLSTALFICACNCVFCEGTYDPYIASVLCFVYPLDTRSSGRLEIRAEEEHA